MIFPVIDARTQVSDGAAIFIHYCPDRCGEALVHIIKDSIVIIVGVTDITYAIPIRVELIAIGNERAIILVIGYAVLVRIALRQFC